MDFSRTVLALQAAFVIMYAEIGDIIVDGIIDRGERESRDDTSSLMQTGMTGASGDGKQGGNEDEDRPPWRPRKCPKNNRRRFMRRRRSLDNDLAEFAALAGPGHNQAVHNTKFIVNQIRHMFQQRADYNNCTGLTREESDRMSAAMAARGDKGALLMLAGTLEMLAFLILDLRSVVDINILTDVNSQRTTRRRRVDHRGGGRGSRDGQDDEQCLMQMPKAKDMKVVDSIQNEEIKENEAQDIVREMTPD